MIDTAIVAAALLALGLLAWDYGRRKLNGSAGAQLERIEARLTQLEDDSNSRLTDVENRIRQLGNRPMGGRKLTGLGGGR